MSTATDSPRTVITGMDLREHFQTSVTDAIANQNIEVDEYTVYYLVNMLAYFARADRLFAEAPDGVVLQPLALIYAKAVQARSAEDRHRAFQHLGDVALLVAGLFSESLRRRVVDVDYYIAMGSTAYACLSEEGQRSRQGHARGAIFAELSQKFLLLVDVLAEVAERCRLGASQDLLRLYEVWARTGSARCARKLRSFGMEPVATGFGRSFS